MLLVHISLASCACLLLLRLLLRLVRLAIVARRPSLVRVLRTLGKTCNHLTAQLVLFVSVIRLKNPLHQGA
jgi:hypothetical protein